MNRATRPQGERAQTARLYGWERIWGHRVLSEQQPFDKPPRSCCSLSVRKVAAANRMPRESMPYIDGVVVTIPVGELSGLDRREVGYDRLLLSRKHFDLPDDSRVLDVHVYASKISHRGIADEHYPILQSYMDCVMQGYTDKFGEEGLQHFVDSTVGWGGVIDDDRAKPRYPRAVNVSEEQRQHFDNLIIDKNEI